VPATPGRHWRHSRGTQNARAEYTDAGAPARQDPPAALTNTSRGAYRWSRIQGNPAQSDWIYEPLATMRADESEYCLDKDSQIGA